MHLHLTSIVCFPFRGPIRRSMRRMLLLALATILFGPSTPAGADGPFLVKDIERTGDPHFVPCHFTCPPPAPVYGALLSQLTPLGDLLVFLADDRTHGTEPWVTDGTEEGTRLLGDLTPGVAGSRIRVLAPVQDRMLLWVETDGDGEEGLWSTDGTTEGTSFVSACDGCSEFEHTLVARFDDQVFFQLYRDGSLHLFRSDGSGIEVVTDLCQRPASGLCLDRVHRAREWKGALYFDTFFADGRARVFRLDQATSAPFPVESPCTWTQELVSRGAEVWFAGTCQSLETGLYTAGVYAADSPVSEPRLIRSFGSWSPAGGTPPSELPGLLTPLGDHRAAFRLGDGLWITDGTPGGTVPGPTLGSVSRLTALEDLVLVAASVDGQSGLWALADDGALLELARVRAEMIDVENGEAYFAADDSSHGTEPWVTDGTLAGTRRIGDLAPGPSPSDPGHGGLEPTGFVRAGDLVYFAADDGAHDTELWAVGAGRPTEPASCLADAGALCLQGARFRVEVSWRDFRGHAGRGNAIPQTADTGSFWFFDEANHELAVKVLDGRRANGHFWVFHGSLTNVEYTLTVTDTETGAVWTHTNPLRHFGSGADIRAFPVPEGAMASGD